MHKSRQDLVVNRQGFRLNSLCNENYTLNDSTSTGPNILLINKCLLSLQTLISPPKTMTPTMKPLLVLLALLAASSPLLPPAAADADAAAAKAKGPPSKMLLKDICNRTREHEAEGMYEFCMSTLQSAFDAAKIDASGPVDVATALSLSVDANLAQAATAIEHVKKLLDDPKFDAGTKTCLRSCSESWESAVTDFQRIKDNIKSITYDWQKDVHAGADIGTAASSAKYTDCQDVFDEFSIISVVPEIQAQLDKLRVITLVIANDILYPEDRFDDTDV